MTSQKSDAQIRCLNCFKCTQSYPCEHCGLEPYKKHDDNGCYYTSKSGVTLSHYNAKIININCNTTPGDRKKDNE